MWSLFLRGMGVVGVSDKKFFTPRKMAGAPLERQLPRTLLAPRHNDTIAPARPDHRTRDLPVPQTPPDARRTARQLHGEHSTHAHNTSTQHNTSTTTTTAHPTPTTAAPTHARVPQTYALAPTARPIRPGYAPHEKSTSLEEKMSPLISLKLCTRTPRAYLRTIITIPSADLPSAACTHTAQKVLAQKL